MKSKPLLVLVDGSSYLYRAFHAMPSLATSHGQPTGAVYGVVNMLRRILEGGPDYPAPDYIAVVFDARGKTFRDDLYADYKANRPPMPEALQGQIEPLHEIIRALGIPLLSIPGVEADDVIGTLATRAGKAGLSVTISSGDKDFAQLVTDDVILVNTMDGSRLDPAGVEAKFGVAPSAIIDYLALMGDTSDNVPGVPKVGPKTACNWLKQHGSLDAIVANADAIKGKVGENLRASLDQLFLSRQLVTIDRDVTLERAPQALVREAPDHARLKTLYTQLEFKGWLSELLEREGKGGAPSDSRSDSPPTDTQDAHAHVPVQEAEIILDRERLLEWRQRLREAGTFAFDTETTSLDFLTAEIVGVSFAVAETETEAETEETDRPRTLHAAYVPVAHEYPDAPAQLSREVVLAELKPLLEDPTLIKVGQNLKYDIQVLANYDVRVAGTCFDTMLESYVLDSIAPRHDMDTLALKYLGRKTTAFTDIAGKKTTPKGPKQLTFGQIPLEQAAPYAAEDAEVTLALHRALWPRVSENKNLQSVFQEIEMPLVPVLADMERIGVRVDAGLLAEQSRELAQGIARIEDQAFEIAGETFNLASPKQIQAILFERLGLPVRAKTPKGQPSTAESVLQELADDYPLPKLILEHRSLGKLKSTYTDALPARIHPKTGRVHTSYHQAVTATGRLSSSEPNLQNIPVRTREGRRIRQAFVAEPGYRLLAADYSQIELRIMAHLSADEGLVRAFSEGRDIHAATAEELFGQAEGESPDSKKEQRRRAKAINFGLIYGMSAFGLARQLGIERWQAREYMDRYFERYPGVLTFTESIQAAARENGYVETLFGRRLYLPDIKAPNAQRRQYAERAAVNAPMQGTAADIIKRAMIRVHDWLVAERPDVRMIMQVHDELVFEVAETELDTARVRITEHMTGAAELAVPLVVDVGVGENWDEAH